MNEKMFTGSLAFLSNFYEKAFYVPQLGQEVRSGEHAFNALKTLDYAERKRVLEARTPAEAKKLGRQVTLRENWDNTVRFRAMQVVINHKFKDEELARKLVSTGQIMLIETNTWHDQVWGDCLCPRHLSTPGLNHLGLYLMEKREALILKEQSHG